MTDKELRKLSRLELLELLLEATKENEALKETIKRLKVENRTAQNIENLSVATHQVENALKYANILTDSLKGTSKEAVEDSSTKDTQATNTPVTDREIYWRTMGFFAKNNDVLNQLPEDLRNDITYRIQEILQRIKNK